VLRTVPVILAGLVLTALVAAPASDRSGIRWVEDDWAAAKARALREQRTVAVDVWATWCHSCLSVKSHVLGDARMAEVRDRHVWLMLDFDRERNAAFFERFPITGVPTFLVIDPATEQVVDRWVGSGSLDELTAFFGRAPVEPALAEAQRALGRGAFAEAAALLSAALAEPTERSDAARTRLAAAWVEATWKLDPARCAREGAVLVDTLAPTTPGLDALGLLALSADAAPPAERTALLERLAARLGAIAADDALPLSVDDRSSVWGARIEALEALGREDELAPALARRLALLEGAAAATRDPARRATFDAHRMETYLRLDRLDDAARMLEASMKAQPRDFNHPWRLAQVRLKQGRLAEGRRAISRALRLGYGGRKLRLYTTKLDLELAAGDLEAARRTLAEAEAHLARAPAAQVRQHWRDELSARAAKLR
jgi:thiol-disulfide isomerase/thioredoxin